MAVYSTRRYVTGPAPASDVRRPESVPDRLRSIARQVDRLSRLYGGDPEALFAEKEDAVRELRRLAAAIERRAA